MKRQRHRGRLAPDTLGSPAAPLRYRPHLLTCPLQVLVYVRLVHKTVLSLFFFFSRHRE